MKSVKRMVATGVVCALLVLTVLATQGTEGDPLVTLGYLTEKFLPQVMEQVDSRAAQRQTELDTRMQTLVDGYAQDMQQRLDKALAQAGSESAAPSAFAVVTVEPSQVLLVEAGSRLLLRSGSAVCVTPSSPGLVDATEGALLESGQALLANHMYLSTDAQRGLRADSAVTVMVSGSYTIQ